MRTLTGIILAFLLAGTAQAQNALDDCSTAYAVYSMRVACENYTGDALQVMRVSDWATAEIPFTAADTLDTDSLANFCAGTDCRVKKWYSQISGDPPLETGFLNPVAVSDTTSPHVVYSGVVVRDEQSKPVIDFAGNAVLYLASSLGTSIDIDSSSVYIKFDTDSISTGAADYEPMFQFGTNHNTNATYTWNSAPWTQIRFRYDVWTGPSDYLDYKTDNTIFSYHVSGSSSDSTAAFDRHNLIEKVQASGIGPGSENDFVLGGGAKGSTVPDWHGKVGELVILPYRQGKSGSYEIYQDMNAYWRVGADDVHLTAILPQGYDSDIVFYDWLEAHNDTTLFSYFAAFPNFPSDTVAVFDASASYSDDLSDEQVAEIWMRLEEMSRSDVVRTEPSWMVLDAGNGKGIEATGSVRINHIPDFGGKERGWCNEIVAHATLDVPRPGLSNGNKLYKHPVMMRRALVCAMVDMMMYRDNWSGNSEAPDGFLRGSLSWVEVYKGVRSMLDSTMQAAWLDSFKLLAQKAINYGYPRGVNTNMEAAGWRSLVEMYNLPDADSTLKSRSSRALKQFLLGYTDGEVGVKQDVYDASSSTQRGVWLDAGCIMEGGQCDWFYQGESLMWLAEAAALARDRATGEMPEDLAFLEDVVDSMVDWQTHQIFDDPAKNNPGGPALCDNCRKHGSGYSGRTGGAVSQQAGMGCSWLALANEHPSGIFWAEANDQFISRGAMESAIESDMSSLNSGIFSEFVATSSEIGSYAAGPPGNSGSTMTQPWVKAECGLPPIGWWDNIQLWRTFAPQYKSAPMDRTDAINKTFGGHPHGKAFWAYYNTDTSGERFGFFIEGQPLQGTYGGWYGGKIESMWADSVGLMVVNRHGKTGCDPDQFEDSGCWVRDTGAGGRVASGLEDNAATHTWGSDENDDLFTTLFFHTVDPAARTTSYNTGAAQPNVSVTTKFTDDRSDDSSNLSTGSDTGMEVDTLHTGTQFDITHKFTALTDGLQADITVATSGQDSLKTLQTSIPVYFRDWDHLSQTGVQGNMSDPVIYRDSSGTWVQMREEDADVDGLPDWVDTQYLKITKDWELASMGQTQSWYIDLTTTESVRLADNVYFDHYQTNDRARAIHIDMHGTPGTTIIAPASTSVTYKLLTTDPTL